MLWRGKGNDETAKLSHRTTMLDFGDDDKILQCARYSGARLRLRPRESEPRGENSEHFRRVSARLWTMSLGHLALRLTAS